MFSVWFYASVGELMAKKVRPHVDLTSKHPEMEIQPMPICRLDLLISVFRFACSQTTVFNCLILMFSLRIKQRLY